MPPVHRGSGTGHDPVVAAVVVQPRRPRPGRVHELVVAAAPDYAQAWPRPVRTAHSQAIVPAVEVQADLLGLAPVERPLVVRVAGPAGRESLFHSPNGEMLPLR